MPMILAQKLRTCIVCAYLMEQEVLDPMNEVVNGCRIKCAWNTNPDTTGEACEKCVHFSNLHKLLSKGGDDDAFKALAAHTKAPALACDGLGKGKGPRGRTKGQEHPIQLELDPYKAIRT